MTQRLILISGGIGSGKSAVGRALADRGFLVIDADSVGHEVLEPENRANAAVAERWPGAMVGESVDRRALAMVVFKDPKQLAELEAITHPAIRQRIIGQVQAASERDIVVELPLLSNLLGDGWLRVIVDAPLDLRTERLHRRGMDRVDIKARLKSQPTSEEWIAAADYVIDNHGTIQELAGAVDLFVASLSD